MIDASGTTIYSYLAGGLLYTEDGPWASDTLTNLYWNGMRTNLSLQQPTGVWTNRFGWDAAKRLTNVTSQAGSFTNEYFAGVGGASGYSSHLIKRLLLPNLSIITNDFDSVARPLGTWLKTSTGTLLDSASYGYNSGDQRTTFTNAAGTYYQYTYDNISQLKVADSSVNTEDRGYLYDAAWNLNKRTNNGVTTTFSVDTKNQLTGGPGAPFVYDNNGNLTSSQNAMQIYTYDDENRLISVQFYTTWKTEFVYDGLGRLRKRLEYAPVGTLNSTTEYIYEGMRVIQERDGSNTPQVSYTRGTDLSGTFEGAGGIGGLLARSYGYSGGNWSTHNSYHADGNGNITYLVNSSQTLAASYRYDPFGNTMSSSGTLASANVYRFSSKEIHANSGMYYYLYRFYDPNLQRWINRDPVEEEGGNNLYGFVGNDPISSADPVGLWFGYPWPIPKPQPQPPPPIIIYNPRPGIDYTPGNNFPGPYSCPLPLPKPPSTNAPPTTTPPTNAPPTNAPPPKSRSSNSPAGP